jgi:hypothetical protein
MKNHTKVDLRSLSPMDIVLSAEGEASCVIGYFASMTEGGESVDLWSLPGCCINGQCKEAYAIPVQSAHKYVKVEVEYIDCDMESYPMANYDDAKERKDLLSMDHELNGYRIGCVYFDRDWNAINLWSGIDFICDGNISKELAVRLRYLHNVQQITRALGEGELDFKNLRDPASELFAKWFAETVEKRNLN